MEMDVVFSELKELQKKAKNFELYQQTRVQLSKKINNIASELREMARTLDPAIALEEPRRTRRANSEASEEIRQALKEFLEKMQSGMQVTSEIVRNTYPGWQEHDYHNFMTKLRKAPGVEMTKDGVKMRLFMTKTTD